MPPAYGNEPPSRTAIQGMWAFFRWVWGQLPGILNSISGEDDRILRGQWFVDHIDHVHIRVALPHFPDPGFKVCDLLIGR
jgi:hypothetical protein